jgi:FtsP/CotA-like multicopper oxidase with cupredoxin domain
MVLVKADQPVGDYWMRSDNQEACSKTTQYNDIKGIIRYVGSPIGIPASTPHSYASECIDEPQASLKPIAPLSAMHQDVNFAYDIVVRPNHENMHRWYLSNNTFVSRYHNPTLLQLVSGETGAYANTSADNNLALTIPKLNEWVYIIMESEIPLPHPIHLHGHDFFVLAAGIGPYSNTTALSLENPPRRDTALLPAAGHLVVAFLADNPGTFLIHCHVGWHVSMGFAMQIIEGGFEAVRKSVKDECRLKETCRKWTEWTDKTKYVQFDSGV